MTIGERTRAILWCGGDAIRDNPVDESVEGRIMSFGTGEEVHPAGTAKKRFNNQPVAKESRTGEGISSQIVRLGQRNVSLSGW